MKYEDEIIRPEFFHFSSQGFVLWSLHVLLVSVWAFILNLWYPPTLQGHAHQPETACNCVSEWCAFTT